MGFGSLGALLALGLVVVPILAHWSRARSVPHRPLPTAALLLAAQKERRRRRRLMDLLLLAARIATVAALVLLLARPYVERRGWLAGERAVSLVLVLDDSASMGATDRSPSRFEAARAALLEVVREAAPGSEVALVLAGDPPRVRFERTPPERAADALATLRPRPPRGTALGEALELAVERVGIGRRTERLLVVASDLARHAVPGEVPALGAHDRLRWLRIGPSEGATGPLDLSVARLHARFVEPSEAGEPGELSAEVEVAVSGPVPKAPVRLALRDPAGGRTLAEGQVALREGRGLWRVTVRLRRPPAFVEAELLDADDVLPADDRRTALVHVAGRAPLLLVDGDPRPHYVDDELGLVQRLFEAMGAMAPPYRLVDVEGVRPEDVRHSGAVVLANPPATLAPELVDALQGLLRGGGSLLLAPGDRTDPLLLERWLGDLAPARLGPVEAWAGEGLHEGEEPAAGWRHVRTTRRLRLGAPEPPGEVWVRFPDGRAAVVARPTGHGGLVVVTALPLDDDWSDWTLRPGFVVRWPRWVARLMRTASTDIEVEVGERLPLSAEEARRLQPVAADPRQPASLRPWASDGPPVAAAPGIWWLASPGQAPRLGSGGRRLLVQVPVAESDLVGGPTPTPPKGSDGSQRATAASRPVVRREPMHGPLLFVLLALLVVEGLLRDPPLLRIRRPRAQP